MGGSIKVLSHLGPRAEGERKVRLLSEAKASEANSRPANQRTAIAETAAVERKKGIRPIHH